MAAVSEVKIKALQPERFEEVIGEESYLAFGNAIAEARELLKDRIVWNINSTGKGGGVAEMLSSLIAYSRGANVDARWLVISGTQDFFKITKRIHNRLHGAEGDGGELGPNERSIYESALDQNASELTQLIRPQDVVILHDPQTAGLAASLKELGAIVIWRCHVGLDTPNDLARQAWEFLRGYVQPADRYIFSREAFAWEHLDSDRIVIIPPSIDAFSPKNQDLDPDTVNSILVTTGLMQGRASTSPNFIQVDGGPGRVERATEMFGAAAFSADAPIVTQVSRWDRLKDPLGVIDGFVEHIASSTEAHLVLAGPSVAEVADDPEGKEVLEEARARWDELPAGCKERVHLACLPMDDGQENAAIVNALQRHSQVIVQKSIAEGFGLTVAEGMWKARPVVATRIGGIQDQIEHDVTGMLIDDPRDLKTYGEACVELLGDDRKATEMGTKAQARVRGSFLGPRHLMQYIELISSLLTEART